MEYYRREQVFCFITAKGKYVTKEDIASSDIFMCM